ncbi:LD-carboxypeptidase [Streptomyces sp. NPDC058623]|uniref:S66 peptidase family protein n=1 Tax=Streptomyces sp. NPDC058623 TaxID=3346563 RepID=UPI0036476BBF
MTSALAVSTAPPTLRPGDTVAVTAPAGPADSMLLYDGLAVLRSWDLRVRVMPHVTDEHLGHLAGTDQQRAQDLQTAWLDPEVRAVFCARGGYGSQRMVDLLDWNLMAAAGPKVFAGSSDITALHGAFAARLNLATLHAPMPATRAFTRNARTADHLHTLLFHPDRVRSLPVPLPSLAAGRAQGMLAGGNASLLAASAGTGDTPVPDGCLLVLEETGEEPYQLDRILTQLLRAGLLRRAAAVVLADFTDCGPPEEIRTVLTDRLAGLNIPVAAGLPAGHGPVQLTVPLGTPARLEASTTPGGSRLTLLRPPLSTDERNPSPCAS